MKEAYKVLVITGTAEGKVRAQGKERPGVLALLLRGRWASPRDIGAPSPALTLDDKADARGTKGPSFPKTQREMHSGESWGVGLGSGNRRQGQRSIHLIGRGWVQRLRRLSSTPEPRDVMDRVSVWNPDEPQ